MSLPEPSRRAVAAEFGGQPVLFAARPDPARHFWPALGIWVFAVPWTAFALFWESMILIPLFFSAPKPPPAPTPWMMWVFILFGLPFVLVGFCMLAAPFWGAWKAARTVYAASAERVAIIVGGRSVTTTSVPVRDVIETRRRERPDGSGDLEIVTGVSRDGDGDKVELSHKLVGVPNVRRLDDLLRDLRERARRASGGKG